MKTIQTVRSILFLFIVISATAYGSNSKGIEQLEQLKNDTLQSYRESVEQSVEQDDFKYFIQRAEPQGSYKDKSNLHYAIYHRNIANVQALLEQGAQPNEKNGSQITAQELAMRLNQEFCSHETQHILTLLNRNKQNVSHAKKLKTTSRCIIS